MLCHFLLAYCMKPARFQRGKDLSQILENLHFCTNSGTDVFMDFMFDISIHLQVISRQVLEDCASLSCVVMHQTATLGGKFPRSRPAPVNTWLLPLEDRGQHKDSFWTSPRPTPGSCPLNSFPLSSVRNVPAYLSSAGRQAPPNFTVSVASLPPWCGVVSPTLLFSLPSPQSAVSRNHCRLCSEEGHNMRAQHTLEEMHCFDSVFRFLLCRYSRDLLSLLSRSWNWYISPPYVSKK